MKINPKTEWALFFCRMNSICASAKIVYKQHISVSFSRFDNIRARDAAVLEWNICENISPITHTVHHSRQIGFVKVNAVCCRFFYFVRSRHTETVTLNNIPILLWSRHILFLARLRLCCCLFLRETCLVCACLVFTHKRATIWAVVCVACVLNEMPMESHTNELLTHCQRMEFQWERKKKNRMR